MDGPITDIPCVTVVNGYKITGRIARVRPVPLGEAAVDPDDDAYRAQAAGQYVDIQCYFDVQYAHQPVGPRRYKPGEMRDPWADYDASAPRVIAVQGYAEEGGELTTRAEYPGQDPFSPATSKMREGEDCLRKHIFIPTGTMPVGGWPCVELFHGGGGNYLSAANLAILAMRLCAMGIAVILTEYRVGVTSHVYHPAMELEPDFNGVNLGLTDMIAALGWTNAWGAAFGINIAKITLLGSSFGGNAILTMHLDAYARSLFKRAWVSSPSGGYNQRWSKQPYRYTDGYAKFYAQNHGIIEAMANRLRDSQNSQRSFKEAASEKGFWPAYRENLGLSDLLSVGNGHIHKDLEYHATDALPMMLDGVYVQHRNNRAAAVALAFPGTHEIVLTVAQQESSTIGYGLEPYPWDRDLNDLAGCDMAAWIASPVVDHNYNGSVSSPAWPTEEINRQIFNIGYQHSVLWLARAFENAGADTYLLWNNCPNELKPTRFSGHAGDIPFLTGNPHWSVGETLVTAQDVYLSEWFMRMLVNFAYSGNPNTPSGYTDGLRLFPTPSTQTLTAFSAASQNWNVLGSEARSALVTDTTVTNTPNFASHIWNWLDAQHGWTAP